MDNRWFWWKAVDFDDLGVIVDSKNNYILLCYFTIHGLIKQFSRIIFAMLHIVVFYRSVKSAENP